MGLRPRHCVLDVGLSCTEEPSTRVWSVDNGAHFSDYTSFNRLGMRIVIPMFADQPLVYRPPDTCYVKHMAPCEEHVDIQVQGNTSRELVVLVWSCIPVSLLQVRSTLDTESSTV